MSFQNKIADYIYKNKLCTINDDLLVAVSGGCDSMVLLNLLVKLGNNCTVAHCNFQLRNTESESDELFVKTIANNMKIPFFCKKFDTKLFELEHKVNTQIAARQLRYHWFQELINPKTNKQFKYIVTAHHQNDNIETVLMNFIKGTGIAGLHGILPKQQNIIRPLLFATRKEIEQFAIENKIEFVTDSSNKLDKYNRNYIRNKVIPIIKDRYEEVEQNIANNIVRFTEIETIYNEAIKQKIEKIIERKENEIAIPILKLWKEKALNSVLYEIVKPYNFTPLQTLEIIKLKDAENSSFIDSETHRIFKNRKWLIITPLITKYSKKIIITENDKIIEYTNGKLIIDSSNYTNLNSNNNNAFINTKNIQYPLLLRLWKDGDYFYPLGMQKKKKVSRFLIDQKLSKTEKEKIWILESNKKIIWVIGLRIDNRFKAINNEATTLFHVETTNV